jgi:hypothetical protein
VDLTRLSGLERLQSLWVVAREWDDREEAAERQLGMTWGWC